VRLAALVLSVATVAGSAGCGGRQLTNRQVAQGAVAVGAVVGLLVLYSMIDDCARRYGGVCEDPNEPSPPPR